MAAPLAGAIEGRGRYLRPTSVRGRPVGGQNVGIEVIGLRDAQRIPQQLRDTFDMMMRRLEDSVEMACREVVPGGAEGRLGRQVHARLVHGEGRSNRIVVGTVGSEFARALNFGFTSTPKNGKQLAFTDDGVDFVRPRARVAGRHYFEKWLALTPAIVETVYERSFYNIKDFA